MIRGPHIRQLQSALLDRTGLHKKPPLYSAKRTPRLWSDITGVTLHQTGCNLSNRPARWDTLNAHIGITRDGHIILCNPLTDFIWHAQGLSHTTIGVEFAGNFAGIDGDASTAWLGGGEIASLSQAQRLAADILFNWLKDAFVANGAQWQHVRAHRQSSASRRADPGEEIWRLVGLDWIERLGIEQDGKWTIGSGRGIPAQWGGVGDY